MIRHWPTAKTSWLLATWPIHHADRVVAKRQDSYSWRFMTTLFHISQTVFRCSYIGTFSWSWRFTHQTNKIGSDEWWSVQVYISKKSNAYFVSINVCRVYAYRIYTVVAKRQDSYSWRFMTTLFCVYHKLCSSRLINCDVLTKPWWFMETIKTVYGSDEPWNVYWWTYRCTEVERIFSNLKCMHL